MNVEFEVSHDTSKHTEIDILFMRGKVFITSQIAAFYVKKLRL